MKTKTLSQLTFGLAACAALLLTAPAQAGPSGTSYSKAPVYTGDAGMMGGGSSLLDPMTGAVSVGYDSHYFFRGTNLGKNAPWGSLDLNVPVGDFSLDLGAWYINPVDPDGAILSDDNDELDLYASLGTTLGAFDVAVGYTAYIYPELSGGNTNEVGTSIGTAVGPVDLGFAYFYDWDLETHYFEWSGGTSLELSDRVALDLGVALAHFEDQYSHLLLTASLPIQLSDSAVFSPYIAGNIGGNDIKGPGREDKVFGGASISVSF